MLETLAGLIAILTLTVWFMVVVFFIKGNVLLAVLSIVIAYSLGSLVENISN